MPITGNGHEFFTTFHYGKEVTKGTPVSATRTRVGQAPRITSDSKPEIIAEQFGVRIESRRAHVYERLYMNTLSVANAGFQQLILPHMTGVKGNISGVEQTTDQDDYLFDFTPNLTAAAGDNTPDAFTGFVGDDQQTWRIPYCMTDRFSIKGKVSQDGGSAPVSLEMSFFGRYIEEQALAGTPTLESSTPMNAKLAQLWVDSAWADVGTTEVSDALDEFTIECLTGVHPIFRGSTTNYFNKHREGLMGLNATFVVDTALRDELFSSHQAATLQVIKFLLNGPQIGSGDNHNYLVAASGYWEDITPRDNADRGDNLATLAFRSTYDDTGAKAFYQQLTTDQSAL